MFHLYISICACIIWIIQMFIDGARRSALLLWLTRFLFVLIFCTILFFSQTFFGGILNVCIMLLPVIYKIHCFIQYFCKTMRIIYWSTPTKIRALLRKSINYNICPYHRHMLSGVPFRLKAKYHN